MALFDSVLNRVSEGWRRVILPTESVTPKAPVNLFPGRTPNSTPFLSNFMAQSPQPSFYSSSQPNSSIFPRLSTERLNPFFVDPFPKEETVAPLTETDISVASGDPTQARGLEGTKRWDSLIKQAASEAGIPWQVVSAIMGIESGGNPTARSGAGATGLMQIMPNIWGSLAKNYGTGDLNDPYTNIRTGAQILKRNFEAYGSWDRAVVAYFTGHPDPDGSSDGGATDHEYLGLFHNNLAALGYGQQSSSSGGGNGWKVTGGTRFTMTQGFGHAETDPSVAHFYKGGAHTGLDFGTPHGTTIFSPSAGTVVWAGDRGDGYGNHVIVRTGDHFILLAHLSQTNVQAGQQINAGAYLGRSGNTGASTAPHLHFEVRDMNGNPVDPRSYYAF